MSGISKQTEKELFAVIEKEVDTESGKQLLAEFGAPFEEAGEIIAGYEKIQVTDENQTDLMEEAKEKRISIKKVRTSVENKRKQLKAPALAYGRSIDKVANLIKDAIEPAEKHLKEQETFAERKEAERQEAKAIERREKLSQYVSDVSLYNLADMDDTTFENLLNSAKESHEAKQKLAELERKNRELEAKQEEAEQAVTETTQENPLPTHLTDPLLDELEKPAEPQVQVQDRPTIVLLREILALVKSNQINTVKEVEILLETTIEKIISAKEDK